MQSMKLPSEARRCEPAEHNKTLTVLLSSVSANTMVTEDLCTTTHRAKDAVFLNALTLSFAYLRAAVVERLPTKPKGGVK